ncbi:endonuclease/exonuclease/phosphatase family protein, partial [Toxoplasma gondii ARI]
NKRQRPRPKMYLKWSWRSRPSPLTTDGKRAASITFSTIQSRSTLRASTSCQLWQTPSRTVAVQTNSGRARTITPWSRTLSNAR